MEVLEKFEFDFAGGDLFVFKAYAGGKVVHSEYVRKDEMQSAISKLTKDYYLRGITNETT